MSEHEHAASASAALHERVRRFARRALEPHAGTAGPRALPDPIPSGAQGGVPGEGAEPFDALALDIARFQARHGAAFASLCRHRRVALDRLDRLEGVPAVPADAFRLGRVSVHAEREDVACFVTSGTTGGAGRHAFRTLDTYRELCVAWGRRALLDSSPRCTVLALAPAFEPERRSSLGFMMQQFMHSFDGRGLDGGGLDVLAPGRWLLSGGRVDVAGLRRGARLAAERGEPLLLLATSFALVWLLDELRGARLPLPSGSRVMLTGGFKGRARSVDERDLAEAACKTFALRPEQLVGEYGMTELSSQLYDAGQARVDGRSVFTAPPWLRVTPVDPITLAPVTDGDEGLACFTDLANVDSALRVLTLDRVRRVAGGIVLCGRQPGARLRGCSLAVELLAGWSGASPRGAS